MKAYVDTSAFIAFRDSSDTYHPLFSQLFADPPTLITSSLVIAEGHGWFLRRYDTTRALQFISFIESLKRLVVLSVGPKQIEEATRLLQKFSDEELTLADAMGLWTMEKEKIHSCWSTDRHLGLTGKALVIHEH
ncbi:MAG: type II toxin-antitoxin system VapC family toxin [Deltaproteobacteria bacterium]|nr:type II toxin-antitoxin system VapC family toxin [Deltaproteobacteria bacterium]